MFTDEQDQLDRHQDDDHVLAVEEDAEHAEHEQDRADGEVMAEADHSSDPLPHARLHVDDRVLRAAADLARRCSAGGRRERLRRVSTIAPTIATSRTMPAASKMNR